MELLAPGFQKVKDLSLCNPVSTFLLLFQINKSINRPLQNNFLLKVKDVSQMWYPPSFFLFTDNYILNFQVSKLNLLYLYLLLNLVIKMFLAEIYISVSEKSPLILFLTKSKHFGTKNNLTKQVVNAIFKLYTAFLYLILFFIILLILKVFGPQIKWHCLTEFK